jgi:hypothetical protein
MSLGILIFKPNRGGKVETALKSRSLEGGWSPRRSQGRVEVPAVGPQLEKQKRERLCMNCLSFTQIFPGATVLAIVHTFYSFC